MRTTKSQEPVLRLQSAANDQDTEIALPPKRPPAPSTAIQPSIERTAIAEYASPLRRLFSALASTQRLAILIPAYPEPAERPSPMF
jgi:hypothetical protein